MFLPRQLMTHCFSPLLYSSCLQRHCYLYSHTKENVHHKSSFLSSLFYSENIAILILKHPKLSIKMKAQDCSDFMEIGGCMLRENVLLLFKCYIYAFCRQFYQSDLYVAFKIHILSVHAFARN